MLTGIERIDRIPEETTCRNTDITGFSPGSTYNMHCLALMSGIPFGKTEKWPLPIVDTCFLNDEETKLTFKKKTYYQNYIPTRYIGSGSVGSSNRGRQFMLYCRNGNPNDAYRVFGNAEGIYGFNSE